MNWLLSQSHDTEQLVRTLIVIHCWHCAGGQKEEVRLASGAIPLSAKATIADRFNLKLRL